MKLDTDPISRICKLMEVINSNIKKGNLATCLKNINSDVINKAITIELSMLISKFCKDAGNANIRL